MKWKFSTFFGYLGPLLTLTSHYFLLPKSFFGEPTWFYVVHPNLDPTLGSKGMYWSHISHRKLRNSISHGVVILASEPDTNATSFYVTKTVLVGPKWFWFDQIDLDLTIMIWS